MKTITIENRVYTVSIQRDNDGGEPWIEHDGHGIVSDWTTRNKRPCEVIINEYGRSRLYYDLLDTTKKAKAEGWGLSEEYKAKLAVKLNKPMALLTNGEITAEAVRLDMERMRAWCNDKWYWIGVIVEDEDGERESLWGIESDADEYLEEVEQELAEELHTAWKKKPVSIEYYEIVCSTYHSKAFLRLRFEHNGEMQESALYSPGQCQEIISLWKSGGLCGSFGIGTKLSETARFQLCEA